ncbi:MAG: hypothetical protein LBS10_04475 [Gracilibacteraceae bacterium]|jgi:hypothetical protein|nr:hypothetical protein [Gracilibacteraceae bacterium]
MFETWQRKKEVAAQREQESAGTERMVPVAAEMQKEESARALTPQFLPTQTRALSTAPPPASLTKGVSKGGKILRLSKKEIYQTHFDTQRMGVRGAILENALLDRRDATLSKKLRNIVNDIKAYEEIEGTAVTKRATDRENALLAGIRSRLAAHLGELTDPGQKEYWLTKMYQDYFDTSVDGYLQIPENESQTDKKAGYPTPVVVDATYNEAAPGTDIPVAMRSARDEALFPHEPSIHDIRQGGLGDCYLLAALASMVNANPQLLKDCMRDNGDGTVTVRFYKQVAGAVVNGVKEADYGERNYVRVTKEVPQGDIFARGSLWVQMIEKAYTASGLHKKAGNGSEKPRYEDISGGDSVDFLFAMTGKRAAHIHESQISFANQRGSYLSVFFQKLNDGYVVKDANKSQNASGDGGTRLEMIKRKVHLMGVNFLRHFVGRKATYPDFTPAELDITQPQALTDSEIRQRIEQHQVRDEIAGVSVQYEVLQFLQGIKTRVDADGKVKNRRTGAIQPIHYFSDILRSEELGQVIREVDFSKMPSAHLTAAEKPVLKERLLRKMHKVPNMPQIHEAFSGKYTGEALQKHQQIDEALKRGGMLTAASTVFVPRNLVAGGTGLNAEHVSRGIVQAHAYTVLGAEVRGGVHFIKLMNPWGSGALAYRKTGERSLDGSSQGFFLMELNDFLAAFSRVSES